MQNNRNLIRDATGNRGLIVYLVTLQTELKVHHWLTKSYSRHLVTHELVQNIAPQIDRFIELFIMSADVNTVANVTGPSSRSTKAVVENNSFTDNNVTSMGRNNGNTGGSNATQSQNTPDRRSSASSSATLTLKVRAIGDDDGQRFQAILNEAYRSMSDGGDIGEACKGNVALAAVRDDMVRHVAQALYLLRMAP
jgi:hypothetical protein